MELVDLTQPLVSGMPVFPGDPGVSVEPALDLTRHGCAVASLHLGSHSGTHVDAPSHVVPGGATLDELDLGLFTGPAVVVDVRGRRGWGPFAVHEHRFGPGVVVLVRTGWEERWGAPDHADHPPLEVTVVQRLLDAGVRTLGVDALSPDATDDPDLPVHRAVLGAGGVLVENLRGLAQVAAMRAPRFCALPLRLSGGDGSPVRAVAWETQPPEPPTQSG